MSWGVYVLEGMCPGVSVLGVSVRGYMSRGVLSCTTVNVEIFALYIFSRISCMALCARKYDVSEKINQTRTKRTNSYLHEILVARKKNLLRLDARKFSCPKYLRLQYILY